MVNNTLIILDNGHGSNTLGKQSPDGKLKEYLYTREIALEIFNKLKSLGYNPYLLVPENTDISLKERTNRANNLYLKFNKKAILVSIHCNAAGMDNKWHNAKGWSVYISKNASNKSKMLANSLKESADAESLKIRLQYPDKAFWVQSLAICRDSKCPAVLTENLFQDNKEDVNFLLSEKGKESIINLHVNGIIKYLNTLI